MKVKLSAVIITLDEENNIFRCLQSLQNIADEIIIVDSLSTDKTKEICRQFKVNFIEHKFEGYIEQKNYALSQTSSPYVLSLDADEALSDKLKEEILKIKNNWQFDGYSMNRLNNYCGKWIKNLGWYPDKKLRMWDSRKGKWMGENPHDKFVMSSDSAIKHVNADILHYSYFTIEQHLSQINKFTNIAANTKYAKGKRIPLWFACIRTFAVFFKKYFLKLGILDGYYGFVISVLSSYTSFIKDIKLYELHKRRRNCQD